MISLQLFSLKKNNDALPLAEQLKKLAQIGYGGVEFFIKYEGMSAKDVRAELDKNSIRAVGSHTGLNPLRANLQGEIEYNLEIGSKYIVVPSSQIKTREDTLALAEELNKIGEACAKQGLSTGYHNHAFEFVKDGDEYLLDILFANTDPALVKAEIDVYWVKFAGADPMAYLEKYKDRLPLIHFKEIDNTAAKENVTIGRGIIDFKTIMQTYPNSEFIVEQEGLETDYNIWDSLKESYDFLAK